jgi:hypothetical protein
LIVPNSAPYLVGMGSEAESQRRFPVVVQCYIDGKTTEEGTFLVLE